ncbi:hypothetical protein LEM8419_00938 [Neolewinella maritima]|uniref:NfeD-like C-terminal domain-containing protein n=1 Tax=Neolewinella maritima TaxID=1383882 RepID=A0ABM9AYB4_9BACT|nr:hypothetical protein [Neolewinella maritima]CAH0999638.1 hypothetical protein LEM8419_00938 [Neolewinella maritima]
MILVLTYISIICGGLLVLLLLLGIIGGLELDFDLDLDSDTDAAGGMDVGVVKGGLTFLSIGSWTAKLILLSSTNPVLAVVSGVAAGAVAVYLMKWVVWTLLQQEENVNWTVDDALLQPGQVYLRIPATGEGIVRVSVRGGMREFKARSAAGEEIATGTPILVDELGVDGILLVSPQPTT